jgi:hypothetical protein
MPGLPRRLINAVGSAPRAGRRCDRGARSGRRLWAASTLGLFDGREDWRAAIAGYTHLYTNETFSPLNPDSAQEAAELTAVVAMVGATVTPKNVVLPGCDSRGRSCFRTEARRLGILAYVYPLGAPVLLCILANGTPDAPTQSERRGDLSLAWWSSNGRSHLVIGHVPRSEPSLWRN